MNVGGPALQICNLQNNLIPPIYEQRLLFGKCERDEEDYLDMHNIQFPGKKISSLRRSFHFCRDLQTFLFLVKEIRCFKPDIIHTHMFKAGLLGRLAAIIFSRKSSIVHTYHGLLFDGYFGKNKVRILKKIETFLASRSDVIVAVGSETSAQLLRERICHENQIQIINPGLPAPMYKPNKFGGFEKNSPIIVLWIGRLTQIKRPDRLLDVIRIVKSEKKNIEFRVAGNGSMLQSLQSQSQIENLPVKFLGNVKNIDLELSDCHVVLATSDNEGVPLSLIQAVSHRKPIISTNVGSVSDVVQHGVNGYLTSKDPADIAFFMLQMLSDPVKMLKMGEAGFEYFGKNFSLDSFISKYESLYKDQLII
jgi:glycosyltransferase involved in cell wall biosynthesis